MHNENWVWNVFGNFPEDLSPGMLLLKHICQSVLGMLIKKALLQPIGVDTGKNVLLLLSLHAFLSLLSSFLSIPCFLVKAPFQNMKLNNFPNVLEYMYPIIIWRKYFYNFKKRREFSKKVIFYVMKLFNLGLPIWLLFWGVASLSFHLVF